VRWRDFLECLHSPILRGLKVFYLQRQFRPSPDRVGRLLLSAAAFKPRSGLSNQNPFAELCSADNWPRKLSGLKDQIMKRKLLVLAIASVCVLPRIASAQFANSVLAYDHGTGFASNFTNANAALGAPAGGGSITPFAPPFSSSQLVSIGAGGFLTLQLGMPITDDPTHPFGIDFLLFGNPFFVITNGSGASATTSGAVFSSSISTRVEVSQDATTWFMLDPTRAPTVGAYYPTDGTGNALLPVNPALGAADFAGINLAGIRSLYAGSAGGADYDLSWARDGDGKPVMLDSVSYVRIDVLSGRTQIDAIAVVPEPGAAALGMLGSALLSLRFIWRTGRRA
jgi:hypothetical protein